MATEFTQQHPALRVLLRKRLARPWALARNRCMFMPSTVLVGRLLTAPLALRLCVQSELSALRLRFP